MRTVFVGTSDFAAAVLRRIAASKHRPVLVLTRPDRPKGRGRKLSSPPAAHAARELEIELTQPASINDEDARASIAHAEPEIVCVCAFGGLIKEPLLSEHPMVNVHPSLLPRWRGAAPIERAMMAGDLLTGVSIMRVTAGLDSGPVCMQQSEPINPDDTYGSLAARLADIGADLLVQTLDDSPQCEQQDDSLATYAEKLSPQDRELDPQKTVAELERQVRALNPHIGAHLTHDTSPLGVWEARATEDPPAPGKLALDRRRPVLGCADGALELVVVQPPGRRAMSGEEFIRGLHGRAK